MLSFTSNNWLVKPDDRQQCLQPSQGKLVSPPGVTSGPPWGRETFSLTPLLLLNCVTLNKSPHFCKSQLSRGLTNGLKAIDNGSSGAGLLLTTMVVVTVYILPPRKSSHVPSPRTFNHHLPSPPKVQDKTLRIL